jgi:cobyrinic acid a,c-diamide synthase
MNLPTIVIAGTNSGVGKTTVATGIMAALRRRGLRVQGFKVGPDFIDPTFHRVATGRASHNLDGWMLSRETNLEIFARATADADVAVVEGVMGMFDGKDGTSLAGTTAEMAMWLDAAVLLVLDASALAGSAAAMVHGFDTLVPEVRVAAVVANYVAGAGHYEFLRQAIGARCRAEAIGYLPRDAALVFPERHLGLHLAEETLTKDRLGALAECVESHVELDRLLSLSGWGGLQPAADFSPPTKERAEAHCRLKSAPLIGIARDAAFCFYYEDNLNLLRECGAELVEFSPISDLVLPADLDGIYFGGGYPELHAEALAANAGMRRAVAKFVAREGPVYAECGGFMYLTEAIVDAAGSTWPMAGVFPTRARMQERLAKLGYVEVETSAGMARGHEYRYSTIDAMPGEVERIYSGYRVHAAFGSYVHLHFLSCPGVAANFVDECKKWHSK